MIEKRDANIEKVVIVGVITREQKEEKSKEYLDELNMQNESWRFGYDWPADLEF